MKTKFTSLLAIILIVTSTVLKAQVPQAINFQAIARDANGNVMVNTPIQIQLSVLDNSSTGTVLYKELRALTTNAYGSFSFQIGIDPYAVLTGKMEDINWLQGKKFLKIDYDPTNQLQFTLTLGTIEFVSVPYAFAAGSVLKLDLSNAKEGDILRYNATSGNFEPSKIMKIDRPHRLTAVGDSALYSNVSGYSNTALGHVALFANTTGGISTAMGDSALYSNTTGGANTAIGFNTLRLNTTGSSNTAIGSRSLCRSTTGDFNTAIGYRSLFWNQTGIQNTAIGANALLYNTTGKNNIAIGFATGFMNTTTSGNILLGDSAGYNNKADGNIFIGGHSGASNTTGFNNIGIGGSTLVNNTTGNDNTALGTVALLLNTTGKDNIATGTCALLLNSTGNSNVATGNYSLFLNSTGNANTAIGYEALRNSIADSSVAVGFQALTLNSGKNNTAVGTGALASNTIGINNVAIGYKADVTENGFNNATAIGFNAKVNASNKVVIGNASVTSIGGYPTWTNYSDLRLKENIKYNNDLGLNFITRLKTVSYNYKADPGKRRRDGLIAQDVEQTLKDLDLNFSGLIIDDNKDKTMNLAYGEFVVPLINAVQEQNKQISDLKTQIEDLKALYKQSLQK
jgi:hypothetical protein